MSTSRMLGLLGIWVALMLGLMVTPTQRTAKPPPAPLDAPVPIQEWTTADAGRWLAAITPGTLPSPDPRQRKPPCRETIGEEAIKGFCWIRLDVRPPCPDGEAWEHGGKCYAYVLNAAKIPTSGDVRPLGVAAP